MADILISQLPKTEAAGDADLLIIDSFDSTTGGIVTNAIKWSDLYGKISSFPQGIKFPDGTSLQPSITFVNDTNTGIYRVSDDKLGFSTNGLARMVIDPTGKVGINTLNPQELLHVQEGNFTVQYGTSNQLLIKPEDGGMSVRQTKLLPLTFATNDITRMIVTPDGRVLIGTNDLTSSAVLRAEGKIQAGKATLDTDGTTAIVGFFSNADKALLRLDSTGAIAGNDGDYGLPGQVLTSAGPGLPWYWGAGGGGGGGGTNLKGEIDVTEPAPLNPQVGDFYLNNTNGNAHPSFGTTEYTTVNAFVVYTESGWVIQNQNLTGYVDLTTDQVINGTKTFTEEIIGTAQKCSTSVVAGSGITGGGPLTSNVSVSVDAGDGLGFNADQLVAKAADGTIFIDGSGIRVDTSNLFSDDPLIAAGVTSFNGRKGAVLPAEDDYALDQMSDVQTSGATEGQVLTRQGSQWVPKDISVEGALSFQGEIDATLVNAPAATAGMFWVQTGNDGNILDDPSWGILRNQPVIEGDMIAKNPDVDGQPPQWSIIGNLGGGGSAIQSVTAQNGVTNTGNNENIVLEADNTVVRTTGTQTITGIKTFNETIVGDISGDAAGTATNCSRSIIAGEGLIGGGQLNGNVTLNINYDGSLSVVSDELTALSGPGLKNGADGTGGPLQIDTDWLDVNYTPDVSGLVGDGTISLVAAPGGGLSVSGQNATANQSGATEWQIAVDGTFVRTSGDLFDDADLSTLDVLPA